MIRCVRCGRPLKNKLSQSCGMGNVCRRIDKRQLKLDFEGEKEDDRTRQLPDIRNEKSSIRARWISVWTLWVVNLSKWYAPVRPSDRGNGKQ